ncbi:MAG: hypothetical protein K8R89_09770 [Anaerolineae bacterium]|nr:hypothetical protein [Anaerolineae bacterium]
MDYIAEAKQLVQNLDQRMGPSPYDIGWMARVKTPDGDPRWPDQIDWLLENQHPDGSWGGQIEYYHDRIICTLIAAIALSENGHSAQSQKAVKLAEHYVWHHLHLLPRDPFELVGFELIVPTLLREATELGLDMPNHTCGYGEIQTAKLQLIPPEKLYSPDLSTVFSLEFMGHSGDTAQLEKALNTLGSLGNSPAATAYYLTLNNTNTDALNYLETTRKHQRSVIPVYPFRIFELTWVLNNLAFSDISITEFAGAEIWAELKSALGPTGVGSDITFVPDGDCTSVSCYILLKAGYNVDPSILAHFEDKEKGVFHTYSYERNISVSTNTHALNALQMMPDYPNRRKLSKQITLMLLENRKYNLYWTDKWHASPYYATAHAFIAILKGDESYLAHACHYTIDWLEHTQRDNGSWGFFDRGTAEETAYVLMTLLHYNRYKHVEPDIIHRGAEYLFQAYHKETLEYPALWIIKSLFLPYNIVHSAILSTLMLYNETFN